MSWPFGGPRKPRQAMRESGERESDCARARTREREAFVAPAAVIHDTRCQTLQARAFGWALNKRSTSNRRHEAHRRKWVRTATVLSSTWRLGIGRDVSGAQGSCGLARILAGIPPNGNYRTMKCYYNSRLPGYGRRR